MTWTSSSNQSDDFVHDTGRLANASRVPASNTRYDNNNDDNNRTRLWCNAAKQPGSCGEQLSESTLLQNLAFSQTPDFLSL